MIITCVSLLAMFSIPCLHGTWLGPDVSVNPVTVPTTCGPVQGTEENGIQIFRGIPYAKPPVGNLRWRPPQPMNASDKSCWNGTYRASTFGNMCVQRMETNSSIILGDEDCLYLNVWSPSVNATSKYPVMVWIHGGYLVAGSGNQDTYSPNARVVKSTGMVFVSMNYRLQAFGFMALEIFASDSSTGTSGNYGFMDQILALQWVQDNIANFGGDPNQVTVFGQSSGGTSIFALLASPLCQGLFHKAWLLSASPVMNKTAAEAFKDNLVFLNNTGCQDTQCLRSMDAINLTLAVPWDVYPYWSMSDQLDLPVSGLFDGAVAIIDGHVLLEPPLEGWRHGNMVDVPLLIGTTAQEVDFYPVSSSAITWSQYEELIKKHLSTFEESIVSEALKFYPPGIISPEHQYTTLTSNIRMTCGNEYLSLVAADFFRSPVYRYVAAYFPSQPVHPFRYPLPAKYAFHGIDIFAFFETLDEYIHPLTLSDINWQHTVQEEVISFVKLGRPSSAFWKPYPDSTALLSDTTNVTDSYKGDECNVWLANGLFSYSWIN